ncbi:MAG: cytochrome b N-terminal domain-containing protein, partial [Acidimicrobiales bacterium]
MSDSTIPNTKRAKREAEGPYGKIGKALDELDDRLGIAKGGRTFMDKIFPDHWSFMLGEIALYSFVILLVTGIFLTFYFVPSSALVIYHGAYKPLDGQRVTQAFESTVNISFAVRGGLLMRQMHHWACDIFVGSIVLHMARVFFTGAFRKPRELNWTIGIT